MATEKSERFPIDLNIHVDEFICRVLRGEQPAWPDPAPEFSQLFIQRSNHHRVQSLLLAHVRNNRAWESWPRAVQNELISAQRDAVAVEMLRNLRISNFLDELARRGIPFLLTKGEGLSRTHYPAPHLRQRGDTDLFIDLNDIEKVKSALTESGYEVIPPMYKRHQFTGVSAHPGNVPIIFDVHWRMLNAPQFARVISFAKALKDSIPVPGLSQARTLGAEDALLMACMHRRGNKNHDQNKLIWLYDIHVLIESVNQVQMESFVAKALAKDVQAVCHDGLSAAMGCLNTAFPADLMSALAGTKSVSSIAKRFADSNLGLFIDDILSLPGLKPKFGLLGELFFPASGSLMHKYHKTNKIWLPFLYIKQILGSIVNRLVLR